MYEKAYLLQKRKLEYNVYTYIEEVYMLIIQKTDFAIGSPKSLKLIFPL